MKRKTALLVIDMIHDFVAKGAPLEVPATRDIIPAVAREVERARSEGEPVIWLCDAHSKKDPEFRVYPPHALAGTDGAAIIPDLPPRKGEPIVRKHTFSGFYRTRLEEILKTQRVTDVRVTGCVTNMCVLATVADAFYRGYASTVVADAVAALSPQDQEHALAQMRTVFGATIEGSGGSVYEKRGITVL